MKKLRLFMATMLAVGALVATALPAAAADIGTVGVFQGTATTCPLFVPPLDLDPDKCEADGWTITVSGATGVELSVPPVALTFGFTARGDLGAVASPNLLGNLGPWCGLSKGHNGRGSLSADAGKYASGVTLSHVGWVASAGSALPVTGRWDADPADLSADNGTLVALVQANGGGPCTESTGATSFAVTGVAALV